VFNQALFSEENTFLLSNWLMHTPPDLLAKSLGVDDAMVAKIPKGDPLYIFPSESPTQTLDQDRAEAEERSWGKPTQKFTFKGYAMKPTYTLPRGEVRIIDESVFPASKKICVGMSTIRPGGLREMHWHRMQANGSSGSKAADA
jgi:oxalate decarboxylase